MLDTPEPMAVFARHVWLVNIRLQLGLRCAQVVKQANIPPRLVLFQMCVKDAHRERLPQKPVMSRAIVFAMLGLLGLTEVFARYVLLGHTSLPSAVPRALDVKTTSFPQQLVLLLMCVRYAQHTRVLQRQVVRRPTAFATLDSQDPTGVLVHSVLLESIRSTLVMPRVPAVRWENTPLQSVAL